MVEKVGKAAAERFEFLLDPFIHLLGSPSDKLGRIKEGGPIDPGKGRIGFQTIHQVIILTARFYPGGSCKAVLAKKFVQILPIATLGNDLH